MNKYSVEDKILMVQYFYENNQSVATGIRKFCNVMKIKNRKDYPSNSTVHRLIKMFTSTESVANVKQSSRPLVEEEKVEQIQSILEEANSSGNLLSVHKVSVKTAKCFKELPYKCH